MFVAPAVYSQQSQLDLGGLAHRCQFFHVRHLLRLLCPVGETTRHRMNKLFPSLTGHKCFGIIKHITQHIINFCVNVIIHKFSSEKMLRFVVKVVKLLFF